MKTVTVNSTRRWISMLMAAMLVIAFASRGLAQTGLAAAAATQTTTDQQIESDDSNDGSQYADINGARIFYQVTGQGQPLILIHGYPLNSRLFREQRRELSKAFQVITLDLRGFGKSTAPSPVASIPVYASDVLGLMDHLGIQQAIVGGHSMGGITTLEIVKQAPDRVRGLVLIDTTAAAAPIFERFLWLGFATQAKEAGVASLVAPIVPELLTGETRLRNPRLTKFAGKMILDASVNGAIGGGIALATRPDYVALLGSIAVPAIIIEGIEDTVTPIALAQQLHDGIANSELVIIPGASHAANLEQDDRTDRAILRWATRQNLR